MRVVWLCHFSNAFVHEKLELGYGRLTRAVLKLLRRPISTDVSDYAVWITNGIREFEHFEDVELHIVSPYPHLRTAIQEFSTNGIHYHFFQDEDESGLVYFYKRLFCPKRFGYRRNRRFISKIINRIQPEIVHLFGAENPYYSLGVLSVPREAITIAQLQTLMSDPGFKDNYPISSDAYQYRSDIERRIIRSVDYVGTAEPKFRGIIWSSLCPSAVILNTKLPLCEPVSVDNGVKQYDFVYFAAEISKAADLAVEAFCLASRRQPGLTLDIVGGYSANFRHMLENRLREEGIENAVSFEGLLPTHDDVIDQIRKSRFALLPLKVDLISGTIREAMSNGLPVITTDTGELGTQSLNSERQNVLISSVGDHQALAENMLRLLQDRGLADMLRDNALLSRSEAESNHDICRHFVQAYEACRANRIQNTPLPPALTEI